MWRIVVDAAAVASFAGLAYVAFAQHDGAVLWSVIWFVFAAVIIGSVILKLRRSAEPEIAYFFAQNGDGTLRQVWVQRNHNDDTWKIIPVVVAAPPKARDIASLRWSMKRKAGREATLQHSASESKMGDSSAGPTIESE